PARPRARLVEVRQALPRALDGRAHGRARAGARRQGRGPGVGRHAAAVAAPGASRAHRVDPPPERATATPGRARCQPAHAEPPAARDRRNRDGAARAGVVPPLWLIQAEAADLQERNLWDRNLWERACPRKGRSIGGCSRASPLPRTVAPTPSV